MDKRRIESLLTQIITAANAVEIRGEENMAQMMGICRNAREVWRLVNIKEENTDGRTEDKRTAADRRA